jgi:hypothetical protein
MHEREKHTSGPEGRLILTMVVRAKARTYPTGSFSAACEARTLQKLEFHAACLIGGESDPVQATLKPSLLRHCTPGKLFRTNKPLG